MSSVVPEIAFVYRIPHMSSFVLEGPEHLPRVREVLRMVVEDDVWNAAAVGEESGPIPPFRATVPLNALKKSGVPMPAPTRLTDTALRETLDGLIRGMSAIGIYLERTNHLDDRELYEALRERALKTRALLAPSIRGYSYTLMFLGEGEPKSSRDATIPRPRTIGERERLLPLPS